MKKVLVTGGTGFAGSHLLDYYLKKNVELFAIKRWRSELVNVEHIKSGVKWIECDIVDKKSVSKVIKKIKPDFINHLAAQSFVPVSWEYPYKTFEVNVSGTLNIFEAILEYCPKCAIQVAGSSEEYGVPKVIPITEEMLPEPCSPYAVSKLAMDKMAGMYHKSYGLKVVITRAFNHSGKRRGSVFVCSNFAKQLIEIRNGAEPVVYVGNIDSKRDFTDVKDIVRAYAVAVKKCKYGEPYNISSNKVITIREVLNKLIKLSGVVVTIKQDRNRMRPSDLHTLQGDNSKFCKRTGWKPKISLDEMLESVLEYWENKIEGNYYDHSNR